MGDGPTVDEQREFLARVVSALEKAGIPYMITGSIGSSLFGDPRATRDIDFVVAPIEAQLSAFILDIETDYYLSREAAKEAFQNRSMFNIINAFIGWKADIILRKNTTYEKEKFQRRIPAEYLGVAINVATPEDIILSKLQWSRASNSEMQYRDVEGVIRIQRGRLDLDYLRRWAKELGVEALLEKALREAV
ncbi:MAG: hypothetical protein C4524_14620 [Candidatus Zixiibacteriota bacterium]|nr:MAG: hypothetical protein C4524_14620 [candidate division Zixibacteria bacterium]